MHFHQFYVGCLAHASYLVGDGGEAVVVDPSRDVDMYLEEAAAHGLTIRWVLETHLHADFVSGHLELAAKTGATIALGARAEAGFPHRALRDGDTIALGDVRIRALETPGHTPESLTFLVYEHATDAEPWAALTGDTLFVGDVGRVDILSSRLPVTELAGMMYDSVHERLLRLPDATRVYPAHGAGSLCGRGISKDRWSTIGRERQMNPALAPMTREAFVADVTRDVPETPIYFLHSRDLNRSGPPLRPDAGLPPSLTHAEAAAAVATGALLVDTREREAYGREHAAGAMWVGLDGQYASWMGTLAAPDTPLVLIAESDRAEEAAIRLARVGYERVLGVLAFSGAEWRAAGGRLASLPAESIDDVTTGLPEGRRVLDVRRAREWEAGHIAGAVHVPLSDLIARAPELDPATEWLIVCATGYRSTIAGSVLERAGLTHLVNTTGGMEAWSRTGKPVAVGA